MKNTKLSDALAVSFVNSDIHANTHDMSNVKRTEKISVWKNDIVLSQISLMNNSSNPIEVEVRTKEFTSEKGYKIETKNIEIYSIKKVKAYTKMPGYASYTRPVPEGDRQEVDEVLIPQIRITIPAKGQQTVLVKIHTPSEVRAGEYFGDVELLNKTDSESHPLSYDLEVLDIVLPDSSSFKDTFSIDLWQNPFAVAEYYDVKPFSSEHLKILEPHMKLYKEIGGDTITASIVEDSWVGQTYSKYDIKFPSMIKWIKTENNTLEFDYSDLDRWLKFNIDLDIGNKIVLYGLAPWNEKIIFFDKKSNSYLELPINQENESFDWLKEFLIDLSTHIKKHYNKQSIYLGIDERGFDKNLLDLIFQVNEEYESNFKLTGAVNNLEETKDVIDLFDEISINLAVTKDHLDIVERIMRERKKLNLKTTLYSCTGNKPGNFSLSAPGESYWTIIYGYLLGCDGYLRWAYDSWVENPLEDTTHNAFEAGDCFLVFPDEKDTENPITRSSLRYEKLSEGMRDAYKLLTLENLSKQDLVDKNSLLKIIDNTYDQSDLYLTDTGKKQLAEDNEHLREHINRLTKIVLEK